MKTAGVSRADRRARAAWRLSLAVLAFSLPAAALEVDEPAPAPQVSRWLYGDPINPAEPDGREGYVLLFWRTSPKFAAAEWAEFTRQYERYGGRMAFAVIVPEVDAEALEEFLAGLEQPPAFSVAIDQGRATFDAYDVPEGPKGMPEWQYTRHFILDRDGVALWVEPIGPFDTRMFEPDFTTVIKRIAGGTWEDYCKRREEAMKIFSAATHRVGGGDFDGMTREEQDEAFAAVDRLAGLDPQLYTIREMGLLVTLAVKRFDKVDDIYERWMGESWDLWPGLYALGRVASDPTRVAYDDDGKETEAENDEEGIFVVYRPAAAEKALRRALELAPDEIWPRVELAVLLIHLERQDEADALLDAVPAQREELKQKVEDKVKSREAKKRQREINRRKMREVRQKKAEENRGVETPDEVF